MNLKDAREHLMSVLTGADIRTFYGFGKFATPCARIYPAAPWIEPSGLLNGRRIQRWEVWAVSGKVDATASFDDLEALVIKIDNALRNDPQWANLMWQRPGVVNMGGTVYYASRGVILTRAEV